ncbi:UDP-N-acetylmuramoyl-tripeptide--D-alanyl-D-alanine ligase [Rheinheimera sp.]|uniref:UDP-N-acetylmuramoyl-tripeptide--D-alanyl-D- alanine ligase n=1 Tax=Rheinheimera sp. TaxID=1869214 RepID=UPI00307E97BF
MIRLTTTEIASAVQGQLHGADVAIESVSTDSRAIAPGDLFIALKGPNFDAHQFAADVVSKGAAALVVEQLQDLAVPQILVKDCRLALGALGAAVRQRVNPKTVAVTGSVGKTTVKEMMAAILGSIGHVLATAGNFNNDIGAPLTLLRLTAQHTHAVMELGANHLGEIAYTAGLSQPSVSVITNVGAAHLEGFGDLFGVARAKGEIYGALPAGGTAVVPLDSEFAEYWLKRLGDKKVLTFSATQKADFYAEHIVLNEQGCAGFDLVCPQGRILIQLALPGKHNVANALAAAAAVLQLGASLTDVQLGLASMKPVKGRINVIQATPALRLIDDTYNANSESVKAAIDLLSTYPGYQVLVFGDMGELGADARRYHEEVGLYAKQKGIHLLFTLGVLSQSASDLFNGQGAHFSSRQQLIQKLGPLLDQQPQATVLVKGSRSAKMELVVQDLLERSQQESRPC